MTGVSAVTVGTAHTLLLKTNGSLWACGYNYNGQFGDGTTTSRSSPVQVMTGVSAVSTGTDHTMIQKTDGSLWTCGDNRFGQLGDGTTTDQTTFTQLF
jgi:alpha-tubulin suppressor-like RCC1 family protein